MIRRRLFKLCKNFDQKLPVKNIPMQKFYFKPPKWVKMDNVKEGLPNSTTYSVFLTNNNDGYFFKFKFI